MATDWTEKFLASLRKKGNVTIAAKAARIVRQTAYDRKANDPEFANAWAEALEEAGDLLEEEARRRAQDGTLKPIYQQGRKVGTIREYSDTLLIFLLKGLKPEKFRERAQVEHTGKGGKPIEVKHDFDDLRELPADELLARYRDKIRALGGDRERPGGDPA